MYDIFDKLMKEHGITPYRVSADTGVPQSTLSGWKASGRTPQRRTLKKVSEYFGVSVEYLEGKADEKKPALVSESGISDDEQRLIDNYRVLNAEGREKAADYLDDLVQSGKYKKRDSDGMGREA